MATLSDVTNPEHLQFAEQLQKRHPDIFRELGRNELAVRLAKVEDCHKSFLLASGQTSIDWLRLRDDYLFSMPWRTYSRRLYEIETKLKTALETPGMSTGLMATISNATNHKAQLKRNARFAPGTEDAAALDAAPERRASARENRPHEANRLEIDRQGQASGLSEAVKPAGTTTTYYRQR